MPNHPNQDQFLLVGEILIILGRESLEERVSRITLE